LAKFLNTSATNYFLEELIKNASERLILISPFLKFNDRLKELLEDKNRLKIDVRIVYGKNELQPEEINWLKELEFIRTSFCKNLHAKCYLNERSCIITSLNLYEFSQINNNEMGVALNRSEDSELYRDAWEEAQRIIRISDEIRMSLEKISEGTAEITPATEPASTYTAPTQTASTHAHAASTHTSSTYTRKLTTARLGKKLELGTRAMLDKLVEAGYLEGRERNHYLTRLGKEIGGEFRTGKFGTYFLWPETLFMDQQIGE